MINTKIKMSAIVLSFVLASHANATVYTYDTDVHLYAGQIGGSAAGDSVTHLDGSSVTVHSGGQIHLRGSLETQGSYTSTFMAGSYVETYAGAIVNHTGQTVVNNYGTLVLNEGTTINYTSGTKYFSRAGSYSTNNAEVINNGDFVFESGSTVNGSGSFTQNSGGSIIVNGEITQGSINIVGSGYLGGSGTINGNVYASGSDVIINSGNSPGVLKINGDLVVEEGAKIIMEIGAAGHDTLQVSGEFDLQAGTEIIFDFLDGLDETILESFELGDFFETVPTTPGGTVPVLDIAPFSELVFGFKSQNDDIIALNIGSGGQIVKVPEPGNLGLFFVGLLALTFRRRGLV